MKIVRGIFLALLASLVTGLVIGTAIRLRLERPVRYFVEAAMPSTPEVSAALLTSSPPRHIRNPGTPILDPRQHEEQVG